MPRIAPRPVLLVAAGEIASEAATNRRQQTAGARRVFTARLTVGRLLSDSHKLRAIGGIPVSTQAKGTFKIDSWDEEPHGDAGGLARAVVRQTYSGDISGDGRADWLMLYRSDKTADFVGYLRVEGGIGGRAGSLVFQSRGEFDGRQAAGPLEIVRGSGTGELAGIVGRGRLQAPMGGEPVVWLDYDFE
jgi:hypothetical protein